MTEQAPPCPDAEIVERMERDLPAESEGELETRAMYLRLISRIRDLELDEPDPGWEERAVERWRREAGASTRTAVISAVVTATELDLEHSRQRNRRGRWG